jgi:hypothetical protein
MQFVGGVFSYDAAADDEDGTWCDWWLIEDLQYPLTRLSAAAGYPRDEITVSPITMDDMRKGCWDQKARLEDMDVNHVEASLAFPELPALLRTDLCGAPGQDARRPLREGLQRLDDRRVVLRAPNGRLIP